MSGLIGYASNDGDADRRAILRLEQQWLDCHDSKVLNEILADDFLHPVGSCQLLTKQQDIGWLVNHPNRAGFQSSYENMAVSLYGSTAVVRTIIRETDPKGATLSRRIATDIFVKRKDHWQAISTQDNIIPSN